MITLSQLANTHRPKKKVQRVGRGVGSKRGKTCGRGNKGDKARQGYKYRFGHEGGKFLYIKSYLLKVLPMGALPLMYLQLICK